MSFNTTQRDRELAMLREKKLTTLFNRHFSDAAAAIAAERKAAEVALREIERRRAEAALRLASNPGKAEAGQTLTKLDEMYFELKRREESVRKRERDTLEKYHRYMQTAHTYNQTHHLGATTASGATTGASATANSPLSSLSGTGTSPLRDRFYARRDPGFVVDASSSTHSL